MEDAFIYDDVVLTPKQQIPIHTQDEWELSYIICGRGLMFIGNEKQRFCEGEVVLIPPSPQTMLIISELQHLHPILHPKVRNWVFCLGLKA